MVSKVNKIMRKSGLGHENKITFIAVELHHRLGLFL